MEYFLEIDPFLKLWSMPHPVVYILGVSKEAEALKIIMHRYCTEIEETKTQLEKIQKTLFERKTSKTLGLWLRRMQSLEAQEQSLRKSFELARSLWMLEHTLLLTYEAITRWRRAKDDTNTDASRSEDRQQEEAESAACYEECGYEQASVSWDIRGLLETEESSVSCDEPMRWYFQEKYCACKDCNYYFAKRDLGILGLIRRGDQWTSSTLFDEDGVDPFDCFFCIECFKNVDCGPLSSNHKNSSRLTTEAPSSNSADHGTSENSNPKNGTTSSTSKKLRKKKKKKKLRDSSSLQLISDGILSSSCPSPTSVVPECMETPICEDEKSTQEGPGVEAGNAFQQSLEDTKHDDDNYYKKEVLPEDPNELWVDYLCKTGSIIALDKYMDEMEPILGITTH